MKSFKSFRLDEAFGRARFNQQLKKKGIDVNKQHSSNVKDAAAAKKRASAASKDHTAFRKKYPNVKFDEKVEDNITELTAAEKKLVNQMYDKKGNLTPLGKKVMNHGKKPGDKNYIESVNEEDDAPASPDEAGMAMDQAKFIGYVADEIMEYIQGNNEFPEWMQNKLSALHEKAKDMHAVMAGKYESVEEARKYTPPTKAEIEADKKKDRAGKKRPSMSAKSAKKSIYKNMMGGLKEEDKVECPKCKGEGCDHCDGKGYHMTEAKQKNWIVTVVKPINKLKKGMKVIVPARNTAEAMKKALKKMGENPAAIGSGHLDVKLDEALDEISRSMTPMRNKFGGSVIPKKFDAYKKFVKKNNVDEPTVYMIMDNPDAAESKRMMKNKDIAQAVSLYKDAQRKESVQIDEAKFTPKEIKMAIGIASDPRYKGGNMTGAAKAIDKIKKGLSDYPQVAAVLKRQNESVDLEEKLQVSDGMAKWIEDFQKSDAPQFVEKDKNERREMAIAAYLAAKRKNKDIEEAKKSSGKKLNPDQIRRALATDKAKAKGKDKVTLKKAPWDK